MTRMRKEWDERQGTEDQQGVGEVQVLYDAGTVANDAAPVSWSYDDISFYIWHLESG